MARDKNLTLGAGKLFFDRWDADDQPTGEFYIGNTTTLTRSIDEERQEHYSSDTAEREKDASIVTRSDVALAFTTDDIQPENIALMFKGIKDTLTIAPATGESETLTVNRGRWYQLGVDADNPTGLRGLSDLVLSGITNTNNVNFIFDATLGRFYVQDDAPDISDGESVTATYNIEASSRTIYIGQGDQVRGSLRYIADNTTGPNVDYYWPKVEISPDGDYEFKGDSWNEMSFSGEVLKKDDTTAKEYGDGRPTITT